MTLQSEFILAVKAGLILRGDEKNCEKVGSCARRQTASCKPQAISRMHRDTAVRCKLQIRSNIFFILLISVIQLQSALTSLQLAACSLSLSYLNNIDCPL